MRSTDWLVPEFTEKKTDTSLESQILGSASASTLAAELWKEMENGGKNVVDVKDLTSAQRAESPQRLERASLLSSPGALRKVLESISDIVHAAPKESPPAEWTVVLDLTTDFDHNKDGSFNRMKDMEQFAAKTKGTGLTVVVQAAYRIPPDPPVPYGVGYTPQFRLDRHVVKDGKITKVFDGKSRGYGQDLEELISYASHNYKANMMALIMDTHGLGNEGLTGDTGSVKLDEFIKRVQTGLKGSGREKFDLLDFDACLMSQNGVLERVGAVTTNVVASAEVEPSKGISLTPPLEKLAKDPKTDGKGLGRIIVNEARVQEIEFKAKGLEAPIKTKASIELGKYKEFRTQLDDFGDRLTAANNDPKTKAAIVEIIDATLRYKKNEFDDINQADLKDFSNRIISAIDDGRLPDEDRSLKRSALAVQTKMSEMVDAFYGHKDFARTGGVSVFLPTWPHRDPGYVAETFLVSGKLLHLSDPEKFAAVNKDEKSRQQFLKYVDSELIKMFPLYLTAGLPSAVGATLIDDALNAVSNAKVKFVKAADDNSRLAAFAEINQSAKRLQETGPFRELYEERFSKAVKAIDDDFREQLVDDGKSGWSRFQHSVRYKKSK